MISKKYKKVCNILNNIEHLLILASTITGCVSITAFAPFVGIPVCIASSAVGIKICAITAVIEKYKPISRKKEETR